MKSYGRPSDAAGMEPEYGAIFITSRATMPECLQRRLVGLPDYKIRFVEQVKTGMVLFLFEHDKRELYGVFKSCCGGAMNIVPSAFGMEFPAQVEFTPLWDCKPLKESEFGPVIRENYFTKRKFNFGLSEQQVYELLELFSNRKLPERQLKSERYPMDEVGRSVGGRMHAEIVKNELDAVASTIPLTMHNYQRDSYQYTREVGDEEHSRRMQHRSAVSGGVHGNFPGADTVHDDRLQVSERLLSEHNVKPGQRFLDGSPSLHDFNVDPFSFSSKPMLDSDYLVKNQFVETSAMPHLIRTQISSNFREVQGNLSSKSSLLYDPDIPGYLRQPSPVRFRSNSSSSHLMGESDSPSNNYTRNIVHSLDDPPSHVHAELNGTNQSKYSVPFEGNVTSISLYPDQNSEWLATKPAGYEGLGSSPFEPSSAFLPHMSISNSDWGSEPHSSLYDNYKTHSSDDYCSTSLRENLGHDGMTLQNSETYSAKLWENDGLCQSQYGDLLFHEGDLDLECYQNSGSPYSGYENKYSVFSRLSFVQRSNKNKYESNHSQGGYDSCSLNSVDEVMDMARQNCNQRGTKRKINPWVKLGKAESSRDREIRDLNDTSVDTRPTKIRSSMSTKASPGKSLDQTSVDIMIAAGGRETNPIDEGIRFVDFKRRSQVQRNNETQIRGSDESVRQGERSNDLPIVQQKKRKLIRPNFSKSTTPDDKDSNNGSSQNLQVSSSLGNLEPKDDSKSCKAAIQAGENPKNDGKEFTFQKHFKDTCYLAMGVNSEGGNPKKRLSISRIALNDRLECPEHMPIQNASSSGLCEARSCHDKEVVCVKDGIKQTFSDTVLRHSICQEHNRENVIGSCGCVSIGDGTLQEGKQLLHTEVQDVSKSQKNFLNDNASNYINVKKGTLQDGKQLLPTEVQDVPETIKNSGNGDASSYINIVQRTLQDFKQLLPIEVQDEPETKKNAGNEDTSNYINIDQGTLQHGEQLLPTEVQDVTKCEKNSGNEDASEYIHIGEGSLPDGKQLLPTEVQDETESEKNSGNKDGSNYIHIEEGTLQHSNQLLPTEVQDVTESEKNSGNEDASNYIHIDEGTLQHGKQLLPTEVQESEKNSGNEDASNYIHIGEGTLQHGKQLLPTEVQDVTESEKNCANEDASNFIPIVEGTLQHGKHLLPTEAQGAPESEKNSDNGGFPDYIDIGEGTLQDGEQLLPTEVQDVPESEKNSIKGEALKYINYREGTSQDGQQLLPNEVQDVPTSEKNSGNGDASNCTNIGEGILPDGKQLLPIEVQDALESEKNSSNEDASKYINIGEGTVIDGKQLLPIEAQDVPESKMNSGIEDASNLTCEKCSCNIEKGSSMNRVSKEARGVAESSVLNKDILDKKAHLSKLKKVDRPFC